MQHNDDTEEIHYFHPFLLNDTEKCYNCGLYVHRNCIIETQPVSFNSFFYLRNM